jgi:sec-independent protein translocase protein TatB
MLDIGSGELLGLAAVALIVVGPDKLPGFAADAARFVRNLREMATSAREDVRRELGPELSDISLQDLNPRALVRKHLLEGLDLDDDVEDEPRSRPSRNGRTGETGATDAAVPPPYDADAT